MRYVGSERRIHKIYVTRNTEYHVRRDKCVAVRDRRSGKWVAGHMAVDSQVSGGLRFQMNGSVSATDQMPTVGESMFFVADGRDLVTSPVISIERPERELVAIYPR